MNKRWNEMTPEERDELVEMYVFQRPVALINIDDGSWKNLDIPAYTSSISAAWEVFEKVRSRFTWVEIACNANGEWWAHVGQFDKTFCKGATAPEAICRSALRAVGVDV